MKYSSKYLEHAVIELAKLPGIGEKTALRLVLHLMKQKKQQAIALGEAIITMREKIHFCKQCYNLSDNDLCSICADNQRDRDVLCVVEDIQDIMAIENTHKYNGLYHVLTGVISPMEGVGPDDLTIEPLLERVKMHVPKEIIFAISPTLEGDTTSLYLYRLLQQYDVKVSIIARGIGIGDELEYADNITLGKSIENRVSFETQTLK
jgi:recombination protein RecR